MRSTLFRHSTLFTAFNSKYRFLHSSKAISVEALRPLQYSSLWRRSFCILVQLLGFLGEHIVCLILLFAVYIANTHQSPRCKWIDIPGRWFIIVPKLSSHILLSSFIWHTRFVGAVSSWSQFKSLACLSSHSLHSSYVIHLTLLCLSPSSLHSFCLHLTLLSPNLGFVFSVVA